MPQRFAYLFDMDGVIINSTHVHTEAWRHYLQSHGIAKPDIESRMLGRHNDEIVRDFFSPESLTAETILEHGARKEALYREIIGPVFEENLVPGAKEFIVRSHAQGIPLALATNAEPANINFVLEKANLREYFQVVVSGQDVSRPKPWPDVYLRAAELLGVAPKRCIVFEDSLTGVAAAAAAGMRVAALLTTMAAFDKVDWSARDFRDPDLIRWLETLTTAG